MVRSNPLRAITPRVRRGRRPAPVAAAYSHALAITGRVDDAEAVATTALRHGGHCRVAVLAHARHEALQSVGEWDHVSHVEPAIPALRQLARQLARTRPPIERALVDLELRYGLDSESFARTLGISVDRAMERSRLTAASWAETVDPAMMAWLGPGSCAGLKHILSEAMIWPRLEVDVSGQRSGHPPAASGAPQAASGASKYTVGSTASEVLLTGTDAFAVPLPNLEILTIHTLITAAPLVRRHANSCDICRERLRIMTPVRMLTGQDPPETVPATLATAARITRRKMASPLPPPIERCRVPWRRLSRSAVAVVGVVATIALGLKGVVHILDSQRVDTQSARVSRLVSSAAPSELLGTPSIILPTTKTAALANNGNEPILWHATSSVPWLMLSPSSGRILPSQSTSLDIVIPRAPTAGVADAEITIVGSDGSVQTLHYSPTGP